MRLFRLGQKKEKCKSVALSWHAEAHNTQDRAFSALFSQKRITTKEPYEA
jgi:hypothetical protein